MAFTTRPFDLGNTLARAAQISGLRNRNTLAQLQIEQARTQQGQQNSIAELLPELLSGGGDVNQLAGMGQLGFQAAGDVIDLRTSVANLEGKELEDAIKRGRLANNAANTILNSKNPAQAALLATKDPILSEMFPNFDPANMSPEDLILAVQGVKDETEFFNVPSDISQLLQKPSGVREFEFLTEGLSPEDRELARQIELGLKPKAVGSANITIAGDEDLTESVAESQAIIRQRTKFAELTGASRAKAIDKGFKSIESIDANIRNMNRAIVELEGGASTGPIESRFFPSFRAATLRLEQVQKELGLDVIGGVTFGALSKGELDLALEVALQTGLQPEQLLADLQRRITAKGKLRAWLTDQIDFLDQGGTVAGFLRSKEREAEEQGNSEILIQQANDAIANGADPEAVRQRLSEMGITL